jgi:hypothetical protein
MFLFISAHIFSPNPKVESMDPVTTALIAAVSSGLKDAQVSEPERGGVEGLSRMEGRAVAGPQSAEILDGAHGKMGNISSFLFFLRSIGLGLEVYDFI